MAVTPVGNPYVESSDLVANYPGASEALAERIDIVGVNPFANAAARDAAIPSPVQGQMCSLNDDNKGYRYDGSAWVLFSGAGAANFTNAATGTYTDGEGIDYKFLTLTGSTSVDIDQAGFADILVIGGGAGGGNGGGGGAGGALPFSNLYLSATTHTVSIGAGGAAQLAGITSSISPAFGVGGGVGASGGVIGNTGGSGGGGGWDGGGLTDLAGGAGVAAQGNNGGAGRVRGAGGGGGARRCGGNVVVELLE